MIWTIPSLRTMMFSGLMSRWTIPFSWAAASPSATWMPMSIACFDDIEPIFSRRVCPSTKSITMKMRFSCGAPWNAATGCSWMSITERTFGWLNPAAAFASWMKRALSVPEAARWAGRNFSATSRSSFVSRALIDDAHPPFAEFLEDGIV